MQGASEETEGIMTNQKTLAAQMLDALQRNPSCGFDQLVANCSEFTWSQLYHEVGRLSRRGQLCMTRVGGDSYFLRLPQQQASPLQSPA